MREDKELEKLILKYSAALKTLETEISILLQDYEIEKNYNPCGTDGMGVRDNSGTGPRTGRNVAPVLLHSVFGKKSRSS